MREPITIYGIEGAIMREARKLAKCELRKEMKEMNDQITSYIRTVVPYIVGGLVAWLMQIGINMPVELQTATSGLLTVLFGTIYYYVVRKLETRWPSLGLLLGVAKEPTYK
jgi:hypothetical protein